MIVLPPHNTRPAAARPRRRTVRALLALATATFALAPSAAHATGGGVAISASSPNTSAKAAATTPGVRPHSVGKTQVRRAQTLLRLPVTGRHDAATRKAVKRFQSLRGLAPYGIIDLTTYQQIRDAFALLETGGSTIDVTAAQGAGGATTAAPTIQLPANLAPISAQERAILDRIAQCESKGDPRAISASGQFRGKYQFDRQTWAAVGGSGDPAAATEEEQDQRAAILLRQRGTSPWPVCGA